MSQRQYASHRGVSHTAVGKAVKTGRISVLPDGSINPEVADAEWYAQTDPSKQRGPESIGQAVSTAAAHTENEQAGVGRKPVPRAALNSVNEALEGEDAAAGGAVGGGGEVSFIRARLANEILKAQKTKLQVAVMKKDLVDRPRATALVFDLARRERDAWQNWPPRVSANMAAELGVEPHLVEQVLDKFLREHLSELAELKVDLR